MSCLVTQLLGDEVGLEPRPVGHESPCCSVGSLPSAHVEELPTHGVPRVGNEFRCWPQPRTGSGSEERRVKGLWPGLRESYLLGRQARPVR